jgi:hypothetical protein
MMLGIDYAKSDGLTLENYANFNRMNDAVFNISLKYLRKYSLITEWCPVKGEFRCTLIIFH